VQNADRARDVPILLQAQSRTVSEEQRRTRSLVPGPSRFKLQVTTHHSRSGGEPRSRTARRGRRHLRVRPSWLACGDVVGCPRRRVRPSSSVKVPMPSRHGPVADAICGRLYRPLADSSAFRLGRAGAAPGLPVISTIVAKIRAQNTSPRLLAIPLQPARPGCPAFDGPLSHAVSITLSSESGVYQYIN